MEKKSEFKDILISEEELNKLTTKKNFKIKSQNPVESPAFFNEIKSNFETKIEKMDKEMFNLNSIKIQKWELENILSKKEDKVNNQVSFSQEINILDKLISNTKIFIKNLIYIQNSFDLFKYLDKNLSSFFYFNSYAIFFQNEMIHHFNIGKDKLKLLLKSYNCLPDKFENTFSLIEANVFFNCKSFAENNFIFPIFIANKPYGYIWMEIDKLYLKNAYFIEFLALILSLIPSFIPMLINDFYKEGNLIKDFESKISSTEIFYFYYYLNFPVSKIDNNIQDYLSKLDKIFNEENITNLTYKKFICNNINKQIINKIKLLNLNFNIKDEPKIKIIKIDKNSPFYFKNILLLI
ncbi:MAG: hypothetical protein ACK4YF_07185 [Exilispira sp.]